MIKYLEFMKLFICTTEFEDYICSLIISIFPFALTSFMYKFSAQQVGIKISYVWSFDQTFGSELGVEIFRPTMVRPVFL